MDTTEPLGDRLVVGQQVTVDVEKIAHGGHCVARFEGQVIFVRHAIPGERVLVEITAVNSKMVRADAHSIILPSEHRRVAPCEYARPGGCGGCDFQHIDLDYQRELKSQVIVEQFSRLAGLDVTCEVKAVEPSDGLHWRTRVDFAIGETGHIGFFANRSNEVIEIKECVIADSKMAVADLARRRWNGDDRIEVASTSTGQVSVSRAGRSISGPTQLLEKVDEFSYLISPQSFWQAHAMAPSTLIGEVISLADLSAGEVVCDLYGGVGLFTAPMAAIVGIGGKIHLIESDRRAISDATKIFKGMKNVEIHPGRVEVRLPKISDPDLILLDPPRTGAGEEVITVMTRSHPRAIVYVSCDPASLARDAKLLLTSGYRMDHLVGFDLFPQTQHVECVARFIPA
jgi:tRNA/tmRNA/rRNA uracil-C5-methylase (TrmA/RlmC/RlmD family)